MWTAFEQLLNQQKQSSRKQYGLLNQINKWQLYEY